MRTNGLFLTSTDFEGKQIWTGAPLQKYIGNCFLLAVCFVLNRYGDIYIPAEVWEKTFDFLKSKTEEEQRASLLVKTLIAILREWQKWEPLQTFALKLAVMLQLRIRIINRAADIVVGENLKKIGDTRPYSWWRELCYYCFLEEQSHWDENWEVSCCWFCIGRKISTGSQPQFW